MKNKVLVYCGVLAFLAACDDDDDRAPPPSDAPDAAPAGDVPDAGPVTDAGPDVAPDVVPTDVTDAGGTAQAISELELALTTQSEINEATLDPDLADDPVAIKATMLAQVAKLTAQRTALQKVSGLVSGTIRQNVDVALEEVIAELDLANLIQTEAAGEVGIRFAEAVAHGSVAITRINLALRGLDAGPSADAAGHVMTDAELTVPAGFKVEILVNGLSFASAVAVGPDGAQYVAEAGVSPGNVRSDARVIRIARDAAPGVTPQVMATGLVGPVAGLAVAGDRLFISQRGKISTMDLSGIVIGPDGQITGPPPAVTDVITGLPSLGDHTNQRIAVGPDGMVYVTQGTATNSGVVGLDNYAFGWLQESPDVRDVACRDLVLTGVNYRTGNVLTEAVNDTVETGAFSTFGTPTASGEVVTGALPCNGAVLRMEPDGTGLELVADGLRNPTGIAFHPDGRLFVTENGPEPRGSRPLDSADNLWEITLGSWYGWPDYASAIIVDEPTRDVTAALLLSGPPDLAGEPVARFDEDATVAGLDVARGDTFAPEGTFYVAEFGDLAPLVAPGEIDPTGRRVMRVSPDGVAEVFLSSALDSDGAAFLRPTDATFDAAGDVLFVTHFGDIRAVPGGVVASPKTGALLRITPIAPAP